MLWLKSKHVAKGYGQKQLLLLLDLCMKQACMNGDRYPNLNRVCGCALKACRYCGAYHCKECHSSDECKKACLHVGAASIVMKTRSGTIAMHWQS
jgi:hypothetical protein